MIFLLESMELVYMYDFSLPRKSRTLKTKYTTRGYKTNFLLAHHEGNNICGLNGRDEGDSVALHLLSQKLPRVYKFITKLSFCKLSRGRD